MVKRLRRMASSYATCRMAGDRGTPVSFGGNMLKKHMKVMLRGEKVKTLQGETVVFLEVIGEKGFIKHLTPQGTVNAVAQAYLVLPEGRTWKK